MLATFLDLVDFPFQQRYFERASKASVGAVIVRTLGRTETDRSFGDYIPTTLIVEFNDDRSSNSYLKIETEAAAMNFGYVLSVFLTAAFGFYIPAGRIVYFDGKATQLCCSDEVLRASIRHGRLGSAISAGSCLKISVESCGLIAKYLLTKESWDDEKAYSLERACMFYAEAQQASTHSANISYALLISALECLSSACGISNTELLDPEDAALLEALSNHGDFGRQAAGRIKSRFYQLKRKCVAAAIQCLDDSCYKHENSGPPKTNACRINPSSWPTRIAASYDLRSSFMHTGADHTSVSLSWWKSEFQNMRSMVGRPQSKRVLRDSLNLYQLNAIVQHCISFKIRENISTI